MGLFEKFFSKEGEQREVDERLSSHQKHYDHHSPIDMGEWEEEQEPRIDFDLAQQSSSVEADSQSLKQPYQSVHQCKAEERSGLNIILTVMAAEGDFFEGSDLLRAFNASGLHIGKDRLFHRYPEHAVRVPLFSVCNVLNPGVFDPSNITNLQTRGVALFSIFPEVHPAKICFGALVETANCLATGLGGMVMDGERRPLSNHALQQMREQVLEYEYCRELERRKAEQSGE